MYEDFEDEDVNDDGFISVLAGLCMLIAAALVAFLLLYPAPVKAGDIHGDVELVRPNDMGGLVILSKEPCVVKLPERIAAAVPVGAKLYRAYGTNPYHSFEACWDSPTTEQLVDAQMSMPFEIVPIVNIFSEWGIFTDLMSDYTPREISGEIK